jgi:hypothetical protein
MWYDQPVEIVLKATKQKDGVTTKLRFSTNIAVKCQDPHSYHSGQITDNVEPRGGGSYSTSNTLLALEKEFADYPAGTKKFRHNVLP